MAELSAQPRPARTRDAAGSSRKGPRGAQRKGEAQQATAAGLDLLRVLGWLVLHDVDLPGDDGAGVDHVLAGPSGVYVVNTVTWSGAIDADGEVLMVGKTDHSDALVDIASAAALVRTVLGGTPVAPLLCFERLEAVAGFAGDVALCASENILDLLTSQPQILDAGAVARASRSLSAAFRPGAGTPVVRVVPPVETPAAPATEPAAADEVAPVREHTGPTLEELVRARSAEQARALEPVAPLEPAAVPEPAAQEPEAEAEVAEHGRRGLVRSLRRSRRGAKVADPTPAEVSAEVSNEVSAEVAEAEVEVFGEAGAEAVDLASTVAPAVEVVEVDGETTVEGMPIAPASEVETGDLAPEDGAAVLRLPSAAVAEAGAALWRSLTEPDEVAEDVEAALAEAEARQREIEARESEARRVAEEVREQAQRETDEIDAEVRAAVEAQEARTRAAREALEQAQREAVEAEAREIAEREERERLEAERLEQERLEAERLEAERLEQEAREQAEREEQERLEAERLEAERLEAERLEAERVEREARERAEREEQERLKAERLEAERLEAERLELERLEQERLEREARERAEREEQERLEAERLEAERLEQERLEAERLEAERLELERLEQERLEREAREQAEREEQERLEAERLEAERLEAERLELERLEREAREQAEREEQERLEREAREQAEREEQERLEAERLEAERLEVERLEREAREQAERLEAERLEREAREQAERAEQERLEAERLEAERLEAERLEREAQERAERKREKAERKARERAERNARKQAREQARREEQERLVAEEARARAAWEARLTTARESREREALEAAAVEAELQARSGVLERHPEVRRAEVLVPDESGQPSTATAAVAEVPESQPVVEPVVEQAAGEEIDLDTWEPAADDTWQPEVLDDEPDTWAPEPVVPRRWEPRAPLAAVEEAAPAAEPVPATVIVHEARRRPLRRLARRAGGAVERQADRQPERQPQRLSGRAFFHVAVGALLIAGVIVGAPHLGGAVAWGRQLFAGQPPATVGTLVKVEATTLHPAAEVLAGTPVDAQVTDGTGAGKGKHLVAVPFRVHNGGTSPWIVPIGATAVVKDNLGVSHPVARSVKAVKGYPLLPVKPTLAPGQDLTGYAVFAVPNGRTLGSISLGLARSGEDPVTWQVTP